MDQDSGHKLLQWVQSYVVQIILKIEVGDRGHVDRYREEKNEGSEQRTRDQCRRRRSCRPAFLKAAFGLSERKPCTALRAMAMSLTSVAY